MTRSSGDVDRHVFVANDIKWGKFTVSADVIMRELFRCGFWALTQSAPGRRSLGDGHMALLYLAGKGRRHFVAGFTILGPVRPLTPEELSLVSSLGLPPVFQYGVAIGDLYYLKPPVPIKPLLPFLSFVKDSAYWGLPLRAPILSVSPQDFDIILRHATVYPVR